jgi:hypothetical protein
MSAAMRTFATCAKHCEAIADIRARAGNERYCIRHERNGRFDYMRSTRLLHLTVIFIVLIAVGAAVVSAAIRSGAIL